MIKYYLWLLITFLVLVLAPQTVSSQESNFGNNQDKPIILIQYPGKSKKCSSVSNDQVNNFGWGGWKMQSGITDYRVNFTNLPSTLSRDQILAVYELAFSTIQSAGGGILFHYAGETNESYPSEDGNNTLMWRNLPSNIVALTYIWLDGNNRLTDADTVFNRRYLWSYTDYNGQNDCGGRAGYFDIRNIATHEFGHWVGLGDLYDDNSRGLTMYGFASRGELKKDSLGLGDITGIRAVWP